MFLSDTVTDAHCLKCGPKTSSTGLTWKLGTKFNTQTHGLEFAWSQLPQQSYTPQVLRCPRVEATDSLLPSPSS